MWYAVSVGMAQENFTAANKMRTLHELSPMFVLITVTVANPIVIANYIAIHAL